jgi:hypothetical protein
MNPVKAVVALTKNRGGSLEHQSVDINEHLGVNSGNADVRVPKTKC